MHENVAAVDLAGGLVRQDPALAGTVLWGAEALAALDARWSAYVLDAWRAGRSSLRKPICLCVPSQNGRSLDLPQRQSATVAR